MTKKFIFDVDGTLTPSRKVIDDKFLEYMIKFCSKNECYIVTGSDRIKTVEQLTPKLYNKMKRVYQCAGADVWEGNRHKTTMEFSISDNLKTLLDYWLNASQFKKRTGHHFDIRPGMVNFSIVGRNADNVDRKDYFFWDQRIEERKKIAEIINTTFEDYEAAVAGETGIDIYYKGNNKSQILKDFDDLINVYFFGDKIMRGGNDFEIAATILENGGTAIPVDNWRETWSMLKNVNELV